MAPTTLRRGGGALLAALVALPLPARAQSMDASAGNLAKIRDALARRARRSRPRSCAQAS
jgi:hypothetical protein